MMTLSSDIPLVEVEEELWKLLGKYRAIKDERLGYYNSLLQQVRGLNHNICICLQGVEKKVTDLTFSDTDIFTTEQLCFLL